MAARRHSISRLAALFLLLVAMPCGLRANDATPPSEWRTLAGDPWGIKARLHEGGVVPGVTYIGEGFSSQARAADHSLAGEHRWEAWLDADLEQLAAWRGAALHAHFYGLAGHGVSGRDLGNLFTVSGIEAPAARSLFDAWLEQGFADGAISLRAGRLAADDEFMISPTASIFINATFGWPAIAAVNLPNGGAAAPEARPGARLRVAATDGLEVLLAGFAADRPAGDSDAGRDRRHALLIGELQHAAGPDGRHATYKLGAWYHAARYPELRAGQGSERRGNYGLYGIVDRPLWSQPAGGARIDAFARAGASPDNRNAIGAYADLGIAATGLWQSRPRDVLGLAVAYGRVTALAEPDGGGASFAEGDEAVVELSYLARLAPCCSLQPDLQFIRYLRGGEGGARPATAFVIGLRTTVKLW